jgi:hypothetical protein
MAKEFMNLQGYLLRINWLKRHNYTYYDMNTKNKINYPS